MWCIELCIKSDSSDLHELKFKKTAIYHMGKHQHAQRKLLLKSTMEFTITFKFNFTCRLFIFIL